MAEFAEYQQNNVNNVLHFNYGVELFPSPVHRPIKKNSPTEALSKLKKLLRNNGLTYLAGKMCVISTSINKDYLYSR